MEYIGVFALILIVSYCNYPSKVNKLEKELKALKRSLKGDNDMSKLINELKGKKCVIQCKDAIVFVGKSEVECEVIDVDDEWVKISFIDKKGNGKVKIIRIETIDNIEIKEA